MSWRQNQLMWLSVRWPREVRPEQLVAMFRLLASSAGRPVILQAVGTAHQVEHCLAVSVSKAAHVTEQLRAALPGLAIDQLSPRTDGPPLTLARSEHATLVALPLLLSDAAFRRRLVSRVADPIALGPFWAGYEAWSEAERTAAIAPVMNKLRPFILRPQLRQVIGQVAPRFNVRQVFTERKVLLVNLSKGRMGPEAASLLGSLMVAQLWQAITERSSVAPRRRHPVFVYVDEFQDYLHLPTSLSDALAEARGLGVGLTLAHQHLHQLDPAMRSAVLANARSRICFQLGPEDARAMADGAGRIESEDFRSLSRYEVYAALMAQGSVQPWCSLRTDPPGSTTSTPAMIRASSRRNYGTDHQDTAAELERLLAGSRRSAVDDLSPRKLDRGGPP